MMHINCFTHMTLARDMLRYNDYQRRFSSLFLIATVQKNFTVVVVDYFTKCIEAEALATITERQWYTISKKIKNFYIDLQIALAQISVKVPQTNVGEAKDAWLEELLGILWASQTTPHTATGETTFSFVYGIEVVIPAQIGMRSHRT
ncbi:rve domain-containing protein [Gossypium australe]|uniref:Rve domain-containing protein n=1 Tax=Gossypium australe TaxID=47621 RepID=A0A5B6WHM4_9ROSI|nr:rve domain-containing protein [Gossypium australe]